MHRFTINRLTNSACILQVLTHFRIIIEKIFSLAQQQWLKKRIEILRGLDQILVKQIAQIQFDMLQKDQLHRRGRIFPSVLKLHQDRERTNLASGLYALVGKAQQALEYIIIIEIECGYVRIESVTIFGRFSFFRVFRISRASSALKELKRAE